MIFNKKYGKSAAYVLCFVMIINLSATLFAYADGGDAASDRQEYVFSSDTSDSVVTDTNGAFYTDEQVKICGDKIYCEADKETTYGDKNNLLKTKREGRYIVNPRGAKTVVVFGSELSSYPGTVKISFELGCHQAWQMGELHYPVRNDGGDVTVKSIGLQSSTAVWRKYEIKGISPNAENLSEYGKNGIIIDYPGKNGVSDKEFLFIRNLKIEKEDYEKRDSDGRLEYKIPKVYNNAKGDWYYDGTQNRIVLRRGGTVPVCFGEKYTSSDTPVTVSYNFGLSVNWQTGKTYYEKKNPDGSVSLCEQATGSIGTGKIKKYVCENAAANAKNLSCENDGVYEEKSGIMICYGGRDNGEMFYLSDIEITPQSGIIGAAEPPFAYRTDGFVYDGGERVPTVGGKISGVRIYRASEKNIGGKVLVTAVYNENGDMINAALTESIPYIPHGGSDVVPIDLKLPNTGNFKVSAYIFDSLGTLKPAAEVCSASTADDDAPRIFVIGDKYAAPKSDYEKFGQGKFSWAEKLELGNIVHNYAENCGTDYLKSDVLENIKSGDCLIIAAGLNDAGSGVGAQKFKENLEEMISAARSKGAEPFVIVSPPSYDVQTESLRTSDKITPQRAGAIKAAQETDTPYYDLYADFMSLGSGKGYYTCGSDRFSFDLTESGAQKIADMVREALLGSAEITSVIYGGTSHSEVMCTDEAKALSTLGLFDTDGAELSDLLGQTMTNAEMTEKFAKAVGEKEEMFKAYSNNAAAKIKNFLDLCFDYLGIVPESSDLTDCTKKRGIMQTKKFVGAAEDKLTYDNFVGVMYNLILTQSEKDGKIPLQKMLENGIVTEKMLDLTDDLILKGCKYVIAREYKPEKLYDEESGREYRFIDFEGSDMIRPYFTAQQWNSDEDKFIVGAKPGLMFEYDTKNETLKFIDFCITDTQRLEAAVNAQDTVFYEKYDGRGKVTYWKYDIASGKKSMFARLPDSVSGGLNINPTNDGKYISVQWKASYDTADWYGGKNRTRVLARLDTATGEFYTDCSYEFNDSNCYLGHPQINPSDENMMMFCHEGNILEIKDRVWVCNLASGESYNAVKQAINSDGTVADPITHESWSGNGEYIFFVKCKTAGSVGSTGMCRVKADGSDMEIYPDNGYSIWHCSATYDGGFVVGDTNTNPAHIILSDTKTRETVRLFTYNPGSKWQNDPYQPHVTISANGKKVCWEMPSSNGGSYGFAWADIENITSKGR